MSITQDKTFLEVINKMFADDQLGNRLNEEMFYREMPDGFAGSNQARIELHKNYNGSGASAFGGAKEWGHITLAIALPVETSNTDGQALLADLRAILKKHNYIKKA